LGKVGVLICWDLAFSESFREPIAQGAKIIIVPAFWKYSDAGEVGIKRNPESEGDFLDAAVVSRAFGTLLRWCFVTLQARLRIDLPVFRR
jgi:predicted amidohydrolase